MRDTARNRPVMPAADRRVAGGGRLGHVRHATEMSERRRDGPGRAPIDPVTGEFSFTSSNQQISPPVSVAAMGTFSDNTDTSLDASVTFGSCIYDVSPAAFSFTL